MAAVCLLPAVVLPAVRSVGSEPVLAADLWHRKPGVWEVKYLHDAMLQYCIDAAANKRMLGIAGTLNLGERVALSLLRSRRFQGLELDDQLSRRQTASGAACWSSKSARVTCSSGCVSPRIAKTWGIPVGSRRSDTASRCFWRSLTRADGLNADPGRLTVEQLYNRQVEDICTTLYREPKYGRTQMISRWFFSHPANIFIVVIIFGTLFVFVDGVVSPQVKDASSWPFQVLGIFSVCYLLFMVAEFVGSIVFLARRKWFFALCYFSAACIGYMSIYIAQALKGDRYTFPAGAHREIADIYNQRRSTFSPTQMIPQLIALGDECHPPTDCECWILIDQAHTSGVERELDGWHRPTVSIFPTNTTPEHFAIVNVRRIQADSYSVLGCDFDLPAWWIR